MTLDAALNKSVLTVTVGDREYSFSELTIDQLADLQGWARANTPHPLAAIKDQLDGFPEAIQLHLVDEAREESRHWPPDPTTASGVAALLGTEKGQVACLHAALKAQQPTTTADEARTVYRQLTRSALLAGAQTDATAILNRIMTVAFGLPTPDEGEGAPKE